MSGQRMKCGLDREKNQLKGFFPTFKGNYAKCNTVS